MRENRLKAIWARGEAATNCWIASDSAYVAEAMAAQGWDSLTIDMQHGLIGVSEMHAMLAAVSASPVTPLVRVPWNEPGVIMKALDAGAYGVICPMINTREECERFVGACRYVPDGYRSVGPNRAILYAGGDYMKWANDVLLTFAMIETQESLDNLEGICATPGLDALLIGPSDLGLSLGGEPRLNQSDPVVMDAIDRILETARRHGLRTAIVNNGVDYSKQMIAKGFDLVTVTSDMGLVRAGFDLVREMND
ncbi:aldolase/citrate lyase family protein [Emcibacter sp. SYSU 3D8]|uniref:HpcH/HpaI aldolase family protein n=1 Tax=Emcibacter sp. SYSU 3D8 TaxID=3133969 RepID=UPI0031FEFDBA